MLTIGKVDLDSDAFLSYLGRKKHESETLFVTRAVDTITKLGGVVCSDETGEIIRDLRDVATLEFDASTIDGDADRLRFEVEVSVGEVAGLREPARTAP